MPADLGFLRHFFEGVCFCAALPSRRLPAAAADAMFLMMLPASLRF